jgi:hypothetical protein
VHSFIADVTIVFWSLEAKSEIQREHKNPLIIPCFFNRGNKCGNEFFNGGFTRADVENLERVLWICFTDRNFVAKNS